MTEPIAPADLKDGDEIEIVARATVKIVRNHGGMSLLFSGADLDQETGFSKDELAAMTITRVEKPWAVGMRAVCGSSHGAIVAIHARLAWVEWDFTRHSLVLLSDLEPEVRP